MKKKQNQDLLEATIEVGNQKVRFSADEIEEGIDDFFNILITEFFLPTMERLQQKGVASDELSQQFWDEGFRKIGSMVNDLGAEERKLLLRLLVSVEARRRFLEVIESE